MALPSTAPPPMEGFSGGEPQRARIDPQELRTRFAGLFGGVPRLFRAPGRINLIGEHTDYNDGLVMPAAIDCFAWLALRTRTDRRVRIHSVEFAETLEFDLGHLWPCPGGRHWSNWLRGILAVVERSGYRLEGADLLLASEIPIGAGLSSSAAVEIVSAFALLSGRPGRIDPTELALLGQAAEQELMGVRCGIMDQYIASHARAGHALLLDTRRIGSGQEACWLPLPPELALLVCNTGVRHEHAGGAYNQRRAECEAAVHELALHLPGRDSLRDLSAAELEAHAAQLSPVALRRARHVTTENERVLEAAQALRKADFVRLGELLNRSHRSLRDDFEVSCHELDLMVDLARECAGVWGARMMGGGFGGSVLVAAEPTRIDEIVAHVTAGYQAATGRRAQAHLCRTAGGVEEVTA